MNSSETNPTDNLDRFVMDLDGLRLMQMEQNYLKDFENLIDFKEFEHHIEREHLIKADG